MSDDQDGCEWVNVFLLVPAYPGSPGQKAVKRLCVCACVCDFCVLGLGSLSNGHIINF